MSLTASKTNEALDTLGVSELPRPWWQREAMAGALLVVLTLLVYQPVWHASFIWDDDTMLTANRAVQAADGLRAIWLSTELPDYFPVTSTAFWLQWRLWGESPLGYHLVNVLLHALSAVLWWRVLARLSLPGAWLAAAIFAVHPVNVESVAWISELKNTLAMVFYVLTLLAYLRFEDTHRRRWYAVALGTFLLALLSKTAVAPFPLVLLGFAWWRRGRITLRDIGRSVPFFATAALLAVVTIWFQYVRAIGSTLVRTDDFWSRLAGAGWATWFYLYKTLLPANLLIVYPRWQIDSANALSYVPAVLIVFALLLCWRHRAGWGRGGLFAGGYFIAMLLPILGFFNIGAMRYSLVADRWQYFAMIAPIAVVAAGLAVALRRVDSRRLALGGALLLLLGAATWRHARLYRDPQTLWHATLERNPDCSIAHNEVGNELFGKGRVDEAIVHFRRALEILPNYEVAHYNYGCALLEKGEVEGAIDQFQKAVESEPDLFRARYNLGTTLLNHGRVDEAIAHLQKAVELEPHTAKAHNNLATALLEQAQHEAAMNHYRAALAIDPNHAGARNNLGWILFRLGRAEEAIEQLRLAVKLQPDDATAHNNLGEAFMAQGEIKEAIAHFEKALTLQPNFTDAQINVGHALVQDGRAAQAIVHLRKALAATPRDADAHNNLANALLQGGQVEDARLHYLQTLEIQPEHAKAHNNLGWVSFHTKRGEEAIAHLRKAIELQPDYANAHRNLGDVLLATGKTEDAIAHLEKALALQPNDESAQRSLNDALTRRKQGSHD